MSIRSIGTADVHRITSGQVITDLVSVCKEIIENSIDANSTQIEVTFTNYGVDSVEIIDNGDGIDPKDYEMVCVKHATSKLSNYEEFEATTTLGFRGEAMSSLCSISNVTISTCQAKTYPKATKLEYDSMGQLKSKTTISGKKGTNVLIKDLFHNLPVRQKDLLKNNKREFTKAITILTNYALIYPQIRFTIYHLNIKGKRNLMVGTQGGLKNTILKNLVSIYGSNGNYGMIPFDIKIVDKYSFKGLISNCSFGLGRSSMDRQFFYINNRPVKMKMFGKCINEVYRMFNSVQYPMVVFNLEIDNSYLDINVTPDKRTILVVNEEMICEVLREKLIEFFNEQGNVIPKQGKIKEEKGQSKLEGIIKEEKVKEERVEKRDEKNVDVDNEEESYNESEEMEGMVVSSDTELLSYEVKEYFPEDFKKNKENEEIEVEEELKEIEKEKEIEDELEDVQEQDDLELEDVQEEDVQELEQVQEQDDVESEDVQEIEESPELGELLDESEIEDVQELEQLEESQDSQSNNLKLQNTSQDHLFVNDIEESDDSTSIEKIKTSNSSIPSTTKSLPIKEINYSKFNIDNESLFVDQLDINSFKNPEENFPKPLETTDILTVQIGDNPPEQNHLKRSRSFNPNLESNNNCCDHSLTPPSITPQIKRKKITSIHNLKRKFHIDLKDIQYDHHGIKKDDKRVPLNTKKITKIDDFKESEEKLTLTVSKSDFKQMNIVGQFNLGFILVTCPPTKSQEYSNLFIIDQHASDEKFNFERLQTQTILQSQPLVIPKVIELSPMDELIVSDNLEIFKKNGFNIKLNENERPGERITLISLPLSKRTIFDLKDFHELVHLIKENSNGGVNNLMVRCSKIRAMFASRACRTSIMIGQYLPKSTMERVVHNLGGLDKPWNCPHGRPTMRHLMEMKDWKSFNKDYEI
ncbi:DNA mismatch repair protein Pms1p [[Candida] anglica]|uniref:DNA mismatch repair protein Pms1p n=1 Tax=[Candida] anglica TaxID=148631 RepID=A0ABP0EGL9_9ASCO